VANPYLALLDRYDAMIRREPWWDGRREALVREMDAMWARMSERQRKEALAYAEALYRRGLDAAPNG
jgi:hypothetical protein